MALSFLVLVRRETDPKLFHLKNKVSGFRNQFRGSKLDLQTIRKYKKN